MEPPPVRPWHSASPAVSRSPGSARQAARAFRADDELAESSTASHGAVVNLSSTNTVNLNGKCQYLGTSASGTTADNALGSFVG